MYSFAAHITYDPDTPLPRRVSLFTGARFQYLILDGFENRVNGTARDMNTRTAGRLAPIAAESGRGLGKGDISCESW